jgi:hypothetical protein
MSAAPETPTVSDLDEAWFKRHPNRNHRVRRRIPGEPGLPDDGRRYDAGDLRRFAKPKSDALVACYLVEARKSLLDRVVELHDQFMTTMSRRARLAAEAQLRAWRRRARDGLERVLGAIETLNAAIPTKP